MAVCSLFITLNGRNKNRNGSFFMRRWGYFSNKLMFSFIQLRAYLLYTYDINVVTHVNFATIEFWMGSITNTTFFSVARKSQHHTLIAQIGKARQNIKFVFFRACSLDGSGNGILCKWVEIFVLIIIMVRLASVIYEWHAMIFGLNKLFRKRKKRDKPHVMWIILIPISIEYYHYVCVQLDLSSGVFVGDE